jgi:hypothetical protein
VFLPPLFHSHPSYTRARLDSTDTIQPLTLPFNSFQVYNDVREHRPVFLDTLLRDVMCVTRLGGSTLSALRGRAQMSDNPDVSFATSDDHGEISL